MNFPEQILLNAHESNLNFFFRSFLSFSTEHQKKMSVMTIVNIMCAPKDL